MILSTGFWLDCKKCLLHIKMEVIGREKLKMKIIGDSLSAKKENWNNRLHFDNKNDY